MKDLKNLEGAKVISKNEQKTIKGGIVPIEAHCVEDNDCPYSMRCLFVNGDGICI